MRLILGFMECFVDRSLIYNRIFSFFVIGRGFKVSFKLKFSGK